MSSSKKMVIDWNGNYRFVAKNEKGLKVNFDAPIAFWGAESALSPMENVLASLAACSSIHLISLLKEQEQKVTGTAGRRSRGRRGGRDGRDRGRAACRASALHRRRSAAHLRRRPPQTARRVRRAPRRSWGSPRRPSSSRSPRWPPAAAAYAPAGWRGTRPGRRERSLPGPPAPL